MGHATTDQALLQRAARGDEDAFAAFFRRHESAVLRFAVARCENSADAADVVAETFLIALRRAAGFRDLGLGARPWLVAIALRVVSDQRRGARRRQRLLRAVAASAPRFAADESEAVEAAIDGSRLARPVSAAVRALPESERIVFELVSVDGLTPAEAAAVLEISGPATRARLARARARLRRSLGPLLDECLGVDGA